MQKSNNSASQVCAPKLSFTYTATRDCNADEYELVKLVATQNAIYGKCLVFFIIKDVSFTMKCVLCSSTKVVDLDKRKYIKMNNIFVAKFYSI